MDVAHRLQDGLPHGRGSTMTIPKPVVCLLQACVDPADDVAVAHVADEQEQAVGALAQPTGALVWIKASATASEMP